MRQSSFLVFILILTVALVRAHAVFTQYFDGPEQYIEEVAGLKKKLAKEKFLRLLAQYEKEEFRQEVAAILPDKIKKLKRNESDYPLRNLASIVTIGENEELQLQMARGEFEKAKSKFRNKEYGASNKALADFIRKFSYSLHVPEAYFLMMEGHFQLQDLDKCLETAAVLVELFPEHELTGFALLRMGRIYEYQDRPEEAVDIYKTVLKVFPYRDLASQAKKSLGAIDL